MAADEQVSLVYELIACGLVIVACAYDFCHYQSTWRSMGAR